MADEKQIKRCAIYTRKSTEDGLEQEFNSLDAQRESAENYIKSQKDNGWIIMPEHYDDGGFSGGNMMRPALKQLLNDVKAGKIDVIVIYKLDRLSRSLLDFMKLAEMLEQYNVSVVSVTQEINTSTSAGRMMLNILMTFAQYEREVIAERIRDKIFGAKRRGKFCGGAPILGYDVHKETKKLVVNKTEALVVREMFELYSKLGSALEVARILNDKGYHTKEWTSHKGRRHPGINFIPGMIYRTLGNIIYIGRVRHHDKSYDGEHEAIIDKKLWDKVQFILNENVPAPGIKKTAIASPFKGLLVCGYCGGAFGITYANKNNRRYMYYICIKDEKSADRKCPLRRVPAGDIDRLIIKQMGRIFKTPSMLAQTFERLSAIENEHRSALLSRKKKLEAEQQTIRTKLNGGGDVKELRQHFNMVAQALDEIKNELKDIGESISSHDLLNTCDSIEAIWEELFPAERYKMAHQLIDRITLFSDRIEMDIRHGGLKSLIRELRADGEVKVDVPAEPERRKDIIRLTIPLVIRRRHGHKLILAPGESDETFAEIQEKEYGPSPLSMHLTRAHAWMEMFEAGQVSSISELADKNGMDISNLFKTLKLVNLSPEIQKMIMEGREPESMTLAKLRHEIPEDWDEQRKMFVG